MPVVNSVFPTTPVYRNPYMYPAISNGYNVVNNARIGWHPRFLPNNMQTVQRTPSSFMATTPTPTPSPQSYTSPQVGIL